MAFATRTSRKLEIETLRSRAERRQLGCALGSSPSREDALAAVVSSEPQRHPPTPDEPPAVRATRKWRDTETNRL
jgi:hypothetical protein